MTQERIYPASSKLRRGSLVRIDHDYERCGVSNIFMASEPLGGQRVVDITEKKTKQDWALFVERISQECKGARKTTLVMDNFCLHKPGSLYETFPPEKAKALWDRFDFVHTPKHGSWLNMAEIELNVLIGQCLKRGIDQISTIRKMVDAGMDHRNNVNAKINWQFTTDKDRIKLKRFYPALDMWHVSRINSRNVGYNRIS